MATHEYWSAVEEKGLRRNEITCAWFLVLAAVVVLQIITSLAATPFCPARKTRPQRPRPGSQRSSPAREEHASIRSRRPAALPAPLNGPRELSCA